MVRDSFNGIFHNSEVFTMKKMCATILLLFLVLNMLSSCTMSADTHLELALCGSYAVPGMFCADLKGGTHDVTILEEDDYGRIMFSYSAPNTITQKEETALVICQQINEDYVYFYEDICYLLKEHDNHDIEIIKALNEWNRPLDYTKMSKRTNQISFDLFIVTESSMPYANVIQEVSEELGVEASQIVQLQFIDMDNTGNELYWGCTMVNDNVRFYMMHISSTSGVTTMELQEDVNISDIIAGFKLENGWTYGG